MENQANNQPTLKLSRDALTTLEDTLIFLGMDKNSEEMTALVMNNIVLAINAISEYIEKQTGRKFRMQKYCERYAGTGRQNLVVNNYPIKKVGEIKDILSGRVIEKKDYYLENDGKSGIIYKDDGWRKSGYPSGLANDVTMLKKNIQIKYTAGYILPKDGTDENPSDLPYDVQYAVWIAIQQRWNLLTDDTSGLSAFSISDVSWTFDKTTSPVITDVINKYMRWEC